jgi:hypothetical protein
VRLVDLLGNSARNIIKKAMRSDRFGLIDTSKEAEERLFELLRKKTPKESLAMVFKRIDFARNLQKQTEHLRKPATHANL